MIPWSRRACVAPDFARRQGRGAGAGRPARGLNENYGRELLELHTLGVDGGYTQKDVTEVARCFTGWTIKNPQGGSTFTYNDRVHDKGEKIVLGVTIAAGGDNLAVYIPLLRVGGATNLGVIAAVFVVGEVLVTWLVLAGGRHPRARQMMLRVGHVAVPVLLCCVGVLIMVQAGTFSWL